MATYVATYRTGFSGQSIRLPARTPKEPVSRSRGGCVSTPEALYLTPAELAQLLRVSKAAVYRLVAEDPTVPVLRVGGGKRPDALGREPRGSLRFPRERLLAWLRSREQGVPARSGKLTPLEVAR